MKYTLSDIDTMIMGYENKLRELKAAFLEGATLHTGITVVRMMDVVEHIGMFELLRLRSDVHGPGMQRSRST